MLSVVFPMLQYFLNLLLPGMPAAMGWVPPHSLDSDGSKFVPVDASLSAESA